MPHALVIWVNTGSDNGLSPGRRQTIVWTNADILSIRTQETYFNDILFEIQIFSFKSIRLNMRNVAHFVQGDELTHWGRVPHICVSKVTIIVSDNGLSPGRRQAIFWNNAGILLIGPLGTNFTGILIEIHTFSFKKMHLKMSSGKWLPFCLGLNVLTYENITETELDWCYTRASIH